MNVNDKRKPTIVNNQFAVYRDMKYLFILLLLSLYFISGCSYSEKKYSIKIDSLQVYGDNGKNFMAEITDFHYLNGKIYIWDGVQLKIFIYSIGGTLIKKVQFSEGRGPGELSKYVYSFDVISDTTLVFLDFMQKRVQFISTNGNYSGEFYPQVTPWAISYRDSLLYISVVDLNSLVFVYNLAGKKINSIIKPFTSKNKQLTLPFVDIEDNLSIYYANTKKTEISKWQNDTVQWTFSDEKLGLISSIFSKDWSSIFVYKNYLLASTFNSNNKKVGEVKPKILLIDKNTGQLLYLIKDIKEFDAGSFENNKYIFMELDSPYPHLNRIDLKIVKE